MNNNFTRKSLPHMWHFTEDGRMFHNDELEFKEERHCSIGEDEKIRKALICLVQDYYEHLSAFYKEVSVKDMLAWLEKQGEHKPLCKSAFEAIKEEKIDNSTKVESKDYSSIDPYFFNATDKFEPKFKVGDEIKTANEEPLIITKIDDKGYWSEDLFICGFDEECIWDLVEQKPVWSEEDENKVTLFMQLTEGCDNEEELADWLKSLKDRVQPKQEWSEKDKIALGDALWCCKQAASIAKDENDMGNVWYAENWLKSLRHQTTWKPSDEQMKALWEVYKGGKEQAELATLYSDLKKLRKD